MNTNYKFAINRIHKEYLNQEKFKPYTKYIVLYRSIKQCILNHELPHDWLLPSTRILAQELDLSRTTTNKVYELLQLEKLILSKAGSGNRVNHDSSINSETVINKKKSIKKNLYPTLSQKGISYLKNFSLLNRPHDITLAFRPGLPPIHVFPVNHWTKLLSYS